MKFISFASRALHHLLTKSVHCALKCGYLVHPLLLLTVPPTISPSSLSIAIGSTVTFTCSAASPVSQLLSWYNFNNSPVANDSHTSTAGGLLTIVNVSLSDEGYYICTAASYKGSVSTTALLDVQGEVPSESSSRVFGEVTNLIESSVRETFIFTLK